MSWSRDQVSVLIEEYKKWPCLYAIKSKEYKNKHARNQALNIIQVNLQKVKADVTLADIKAKFNGLKTNFMTEYKKYKSSAKSGAGQDDIYVPTLWYYNSLKFLLDHNTTRQSFDSISTETNDFDGFIDQNEDTQESGETESFYHKDVEVDTFSATLNKEHIGTYELEDDVLVQTDANTPTSMPSRKRKKLDLGGDALLKQTSSAINEITGAIKQFDTNVAAKENTTPTNVFGNFVCSKLEQITDPNIRLEAEQQITTVLFTNIFKCRNVNN